MASHSSFMGRNRSTGRSSSELQVAQLNAALRLVTPPSALGIVADFDSEEDDPRKWRAAAQTMFASTPDPLGDIIQRILAITPNTALKNAGLQLRSGILQSLLQAFDPQYNQDFPETLEALKFRRDQIRKQIQALVRGGHDEEEARLSLRCYDAAWEHLLQTIHEKRSLHADAITVRQYKKICALMDDRHLQELAGSSSLSGDDAVLLGFQLNEYLLGALRYPEEGYDFPSGWYGVRARFEIAKKGWEAYAKEINPAFIDPGAQVLDTIFDEVLGVQAMPPQKSSGRSSH